jgi:hypothetical protein
MNAGLKDLLFNLRQHPSFQDFLRAVERPRMPRFKKYEKRTLEDMGAQTVFVSGRLEQDDAWRTFLTGESPTGENEASQQE